MVSPIFAAWWLLGPFLGAITALIFAHIVGRWSRSRAQLPRAKKKRLDLSHATIDHPILFRFLAVCGLVFSAWLVGHAYKKEGTGAPVFDVATAAQILAAAVAGVALLVAVWAVIVTRSIAEKIEESGKNDDKIAANNRLQEQWQAINMEFIRHPATRPAWEPHVPGDVNIPDFELRLGLTFYIMQILKLTMLYDKEKIDTSFNEAAKLYWSNWMLTKNSEIWGWVVDKGRGFSPEDLETVERWAREYKRSMVSTTFDDPTELETATARFVRSHQIGDGCKTELLVCLDGSGTVVVDSAIGTRDRVELTQAMLNACGKAGIKLYHNHPEEGSLSEADWRLCMMNPGIQEIAAVNSHGTVFRGRVRDPNTLGLLVHSLGAIRDELEMHMSFAFGHPNPGYEFLPDLTWFWGDVVNRRLAEVGLVDYEAAFAVHDRATLDDPKVVAMEGVAASFVTTKLP